MTTNVIQIAVNNGFVVLFNPPLTRRMQEMRNIIFNLLFKRSRGHIDVYIRP